MISELLLQGKISHLQGFGHCFHGGSDFQLLINVLQMVGEGTFADVQLCGDFFSLFAADTNGEGYQFMAQWIYEGIRQLREGRTIKRK